MAVMPQKRNAGPSKDELVAALEEVNRRERRRQSRRTLFILFVVVPVGCILVVAAMAAINHLAH